MIRKCITFGWFDKTVHAYDAAHLGFEMLCGDEPVQGKRHFCPEPAKLADITCLTCRNAMSVMLVGELTTKVDALMSSNKALTEQVDALKHIVSSEATRKFANALVVEALQNDIMVHSKAIEQLQLDKHKGSTRRG